MSRWEREYGPFGDSFYCLDATFSFFFFFFALVLEAVGTNGSEDAGARPGMEEEEEVEEAGARPGM